MEQWKIDPRLFSRDLELEKSFGIEDIKLYGYLANVDQNNTHIVILGEIISRERPRKSFSLSCTIYDQDDDVIESRENETYGKGYTTNLITPISYFDRFPVRFSFVRRFRIHEIKRIRIIPEKY